MYIDGSRIRRTGAGEFSFVARVPCKFMLNKSYRICSSNILALFSRISSIDSRLMVLLLRGPNFGKPSKGRIRPTRI